MFVCFILYIAENLLQRAGRKLLQQLSANTSNPDLPNSKTPKGGNSLTSAKMALAVPGVFLLCCALVCPCFYAKKKETSEQNIMSTELNLSESS